MLYALIDLDGAVRARFQDAASLLCEIDAIAAEDLEVLEDLAVLKYDAVGDRVGSPTPAASLVIRPAAELALSAHSGNGSEHTHTAQWRLQSGARVAQPA